jgi:O-antigen/teichoic acid export membrane protein
MGKRSLFKILLLNIPLLCAGSGVAGLELAARLKASLNLNVPVSQFLTALANYLIPSFAKTYSNPEKTDNKIEHKALIIYGIITGVYALFIVVFGEEISRTLYKGRYTFNQYELLILTLIPITGGLQRVFAASFRALERSKLLLIPSVAASGIVVIFCPILIPILGFSGALLSVVIAFTVSLLVSYVTWAEEKKSFHARKESRKQV